jgi:hypothetical protein
MKNSSEKSITCEPVITGVAVKEAEDGLTQHLPDRSPSHESACAAQGYELRRIARGN